MRDEEVAVLALVGLALLKPKAQPPPPPPPEGEGWFVCVAYIYTPWRQDVNASVTVTPIPEPYEYWKVVLANLVTPLSIPLKSGTYTIRATYAGRTQSQSVTITANRSTLVVFTF